MLFRSRNLVAEHRDLDKYRLPSWTREPALTEIVQAVVLDTAGGVIHVKSGRWTGTIDKAGYAWTKRSAAQLDQLVRRGDVIDARVRTLDAGARTFVADLDQPPNVEGAVLAHASRAGMRITFRAPQASQTR